MKWIRDNTGRFAQRPHYEPEELDGECEDIVRAFLVQRHGKVEYPITTDDLTVLLETRAGSLDVYADLIDRGDDVEGVTVFARGARPQVLIARHLTEQHWSSNRFRTTATHELGHVVFHDCLYQVEAEPLDLFPREKSNPAPQPECRREHMHSLSTVDWMEWQAGYACGAYLIPRTAVKAVVAGLRNRAGWVATPSAGSQAGKAIIDAVSESFETSKDAARVRLIQLKYLAA